METNYAEIILRFLELRKEKGKPILNKQHLGEQLTLSSPEDFPNESPEFYAGLGTLQRGWKELSPLLKETINNYFTKEINPSFVWDDDKLIQKKVFPQDLYSGKIGFGLFIPKETEKEIKGKVYGNTQIEKPVLITKDGLIEINEQTKEKLKIDYELPSYLPRRWKLKLIKAYLDGQKEKVDGKKLLNSILNQYQKYIYRRKKPWYKISALWDIGTYLFMAFEAYPIYELRGISGTAKTKENVVSSFISFNGGQIMANPSEATLFRETEELRGTKYFDEAEKLFVFNKTTRQFEGDSRVELINASYTKDAKVPRQEKILNKFYTKWYSCYSPTRICSINGLYGATETRAITQICTKSTNDDDRGELDPNEDKEEDIWTNIRDGCYRFALENSDKIREIYLKFPKDCGLKRRDLQIWKPLLSIAKFISEEDYKEILDFAIELSEMRVDEFITESSFDFMCLSALRSVVLNHPETDKHYLDSIKDSYYIDKEETEKSNIYLNRNIGQHLKKLGFDKKRDGRGTYINADIDLFNQIVTPICPQLSLLSTLSTQNRVNTSKISVDSNKISVDDVKISEDKKNKEVNFCVDSVDNVDDVDRNQRSPFLKYTSQFTDEEIKECGYTRSELEEFENG